MLKIILNRNLLLAAGFKVDKFNINKAYIEYSDKYGVLPGLNSDFLNRVK